MKLLIIVLMSLSASVSFAQAKKAAPAKSAGFERQYGIAGCGWGSILMGKQGAQIFAATTNGTSFNQWFGISAGTANCVDSASAQVAGRMDQFINVNLSQVQGDIARGQGETVAVIGSFMGCATPAKVGSALKANYSSIFNGDVKANEITDSIITTILQNEELARECQSLG